MGLKETVKNVLESQGLKKHQICSEDFEHIVNETELNDIVTQFVEINTKDNKFKLEVVRGKSILEAGLDSGIDLPYSCQTGTCTLCKAVLLEGKVKLISGNDPDHESKNNECLLCCSYPLTNNVKFKIDNL